MRDPLLLGHLRRVKAGHGRIVITVAQGRLVDLRVVAADVVENPAVRGLDEVSEDGGLDALPMAAPPGRDRLVVAMERGEQRPERSHPGHEFSRAAVIFRGGRLRLESTTRPYRSGSSAASLGVAGGRLQGVAQSIATGEVQRRFAAGRARFSWGEPARGQPGRRGPQGRGSARRQFSGSQPARRRPAGGQADADRPQHGGPRPDGSSFRRPHRGGLSRGQLKGGELRGRESWRGPISAAPTLTAGNFTRPNSSAST